MVKLRRFRDLEAANDVQGADLLELMTEFDNRTNTPEKFRSFMELITGLRGAQQRAMDIGADMAFPVAKEKGVGYADDVINLFRDSELAEAGAKKLGLQDGAEQITIGELRKKDAALTAIYEKRFFPDGASDDTVIYHTGEGVKAYDNPT